MTAATTVSAVIPVHNGEAYLAEAIRSVLNQSRPPIECIVIDDGSTDATADVVHQFGNEVVHIRQQRNGVSAARNQGAQRARGELVAFLDHDDTWLPAKLERQVEALSAQGATLALCAMEAVDGHGTVLRTVRLRAPEDLITGMLMFDGTETMSCGSAGLVRRAAFLASGGFDPALATSADWDLLFRTLLAGAVAYVDEALVVYRVHGANMSRDVAAMERDMSYAFAKAFADPRLPTKLRASKRRAYGRLYRMLAGSYLEHGNRRAALRTLTTSVRHDPTIALELARRVNPASRVGGRTAPDPPTPSR
jgi:glycosyltransferase involved in cell wall biosynthesis